MEQAIRTQDVAAHAWKRLFAPVATELDAVEDLLRAELTSDDPFVDRLARHAFRLGGKRLRPALLLLTGKATGRTSRDHIVLAVVMEMIHTATLIHDDVLDEASLRRHRDTINARNDNEASVLVGDFLFTHAFFLASSLETTFACQTIGRATNTVCSGELRQVHTRGNFALGEREYMEIITAKTAALCECCCRLGAHYAGAAAEREEALARYGLSVGIAFQIADDMLDVVGDERSMGKSLGTDLAKQKLTLPMIRLLADSTAAERSMLIESASTPTPLAREQIAAQLEQSGAMDYAREKAKFHARAAGAELERLPPSPARDVLAMLAEAVVLRAD